MNRQESTIGKAVSSPLIMDENHLTNADAEDVLVDLDRGQSLSSINETTENNNDLNQTNLLKKEAEKPESRLNSSLNKSCDSDIIQFNEKGEKVGYIRCVTSEELRKTTSLKIVEETEEKHFYKKIESIDTSHYQLVEKVNSNKFLLNFFYRIRKSYYNKFDDDWVKKNIFSKIWHFVIKTPFNLIRDLTIPPCEEGGWKQTMFALIPLFAPTMIILVFKSNICIK